MVLMQMHASPSKIYISIYIHEPAKRRIFLLFFLHTFRNFYSQEQNGRVEKNQEKIEIDMVRSVKYSGNGNMHRPI